MLEKGQIVEYLRLNKKKLQEEFQVSKLGLFGSFARGNPNDKSDIDILIEFENNQDIFEAKLLIRKMLESQFNRQIDICREKYLKSFVKDSILKETIYV